MLCLTCGMILLTEVVGILVGMIMLQRQSTAVIFYSGNVLDVRASWYVYVKAVSTHSDSAADLTALFCVCVSVCVLCVCDVCV